ncbi:MAG: hypothetical protein RMJ44_12360 [Cytophagales bacterium]|nr:hypothetical protein [Bernardetiaceae bacterium]MDW8211867.1 hypothetical protein [Cytophagales bacterium]
MKKNLLLLAMLVCLVVNVQAQSDSKAPNWEDKKESNTEESEILNNLAMAQSLAVYGKRNNSVEALVLAAKILRQLPSCSKLEISKKSEGEGKATEKGSSAMIVLDEATLLAEAQRIAGKDKILNGLIASVEKTPKFRGAVGGPRIAYERVLAFDTDSYLIPFVGGRRAYVAVNGDGDTDLDLYVYDENGNLIDKDDDYLDRCVVEWYPKWTGVFIIKVKNRGSVYNNYSIMTN